MSSFRNSAGNLQLHYGYLDVIRAEFPLLDRERPRDEVPLPLRVPEVPARLPEAHERRGHVRVVRAELALVDLEGPRRELELLPRVPGLEMRKPDGVAI